jgi:hypothetical protein
MSPVCCVTYVGGRSVDRGSAFRISCRRPAITARRRKNVVQARSFAEMLDLTIRRYQNRAIEAAQVIEELIGMAKDHARSACARRGTRPK